MKPFMITFTPFNVYIDYWKAKFCKWVTHAVEKQDSGGRSFLAKDNEKRFKNSGKEYKYPRARKVQCRENLTNFLFSS